MPSKSKAAITTAGESSAVNFIDSASASSSMIDISTPANAAGTKPKAANALNRPPTFESAFTTLYPCPRDDLSRAVPGSVTMTI